MIEKSGIANYKSSVSKYFLLMKKAQCPIKWRIENHEIYDSEGPAC